MLRRVLLIAALAACKERVPAGIDADPTADGIVALSTGLPMCLVSSPSQAFAFTTFFDGTGTLTIEVTRPDGTKDVVDRHANIPGQNSPAAIPAAAWGIGKNVVTVWVQRVGLQSAMQQFTVDVRAAVSPDASTVDMDGDCYSPATGDCNDSATGFAINPGKAEICNDRVDNNCDGVIDFADPTCAALCADDDHDGYAQQSCGGTDCNDTDATINPGATELCDGIDNNCNDKRDEIFDMDGDGFVACTAPGPITWRVESGGCPDGDSDCADCDDNDNTTYPGAFEPCDSKLHNCKGSLAAKFADDDGDAVLNCEDPDSDNDAICDPGAQGMIVITACVTPEASDGKCCSSGPGNAPDNCPHARNYTQSDLDADGAGDACDTCSDQDGDGYGASGTYDRNGALTPIGGAVGHPAGAPGADPNSYLRDSCTGGTAVDCDDDPNAQGRATNPGHTEDCDGFDNNCTGGIDEGHDKDGDGYTECGSHSPTGYTAPNAAFIDCNDTAGSGASIHPKATETACDGIDDNCDGSIDEYKDVDGDTYTQCGDVTNKRTDGTPGGKDCNDADSSTYPGAPDGCDHKDNNCNGKYDEDFDKDNDTYVACPGATYRTNNTAGGEDCNDTPGTGAAINPGATEICDSTDNNCVSGVDEGCDDDNDNRCDKAMQVAAAGAATCTATPGGGSGDDCNDADPTFSPDAPELSCTFKDENCNGKYDENDDADTDGYANCVGTNVTVAGGSCAASNCYDCNDQSATAHPGATEVCFNGDDDDCQGETYDWQDSECCTNAARYTFKRSAPSAGVFADVQQESFEQFNPFYGFPAVSWVTPVAVPATPPEGSASNFTGGWEYLDLNQYCNDGQTAGSDSWRVRASTLFELEGIPLGSLTAGTYGNGGDWSYQPTGGACTKGTGCFVNNGLVSPFIDFTQQPKYISNGATAPAPDSNDIALLEYRRFADHELVGSTGGGQHTTTKGADNVCDASTAYSPHTTPNNSNYSSAANAPPNAFSSFPAAGQRCDVCRDGEYASFAKLTFLNASSCGSPPCTDTNPSSAHQCFLDATFQSAIMQPNGTPIATPAAFTSCPLAAQSSRELKAWRWMYGLITTNGSTLASQGSQRIMFRYSTWDNLGHHGAVEDDGVYVDDMSVLVCYR